MNAPHLPHARSGIGLKGCHAGQVLADLPALGFVEVHAENYMVDGGPRHRQLERVRSHYPVALHGVALSIGGVEPLERAHLRALRALMDRYQPLHFSEHLAWSSHGGAYYNDLLPLAYNEGNLERVCRHVDETQEFLGVRMLLENPATYVGFVETDIDEAGFITEVVRRTGCGLLLDVNNAHVSCVNHGRDVLAYLRALPLAAVGEIHLAGFAEDRDAAGARLLIDHHGAPVDDAVWDLYRSVVAAIGPVPTLIERDNNLPPLADLLAEASCAAALQQDTLALKEAA